MPGWHLISIPLGSVDKFVFRLVSVMWASRRDTKRYRVGTRYCLSSSNRVRLQARCALLVDCGNTLPPACQRGLLCDEWIGRLAHVDRGAAHAAHRCRVGVATARVLHSKMPLALLDLAPLVIGGTPRVLPRRRCRHDGGIDHRSVREHQVACAQPRVDGFKERLGQGVGFQERAKLQQGGGIQDHLRSQIDPGKAARGLGLIDRILQPSIGGSKPLFPQVHPQRPLQAGRWAQATPPGWRIVIRHQRRRPRRPGSHLPHPCRKMLTRRPVT